ALRVDQALAQDATGTMAMMQFEAFGVERVQVETAVVYIDHNILQIDFKNPDDHRFLQAMAAKYGVWFSRPGNGICHYVHCERFAAPGKTLVGADSHTTQSGSCAMIAIVIAELGATGAVFPADEQTRAWLEEQQRSDDYVAMQTGTQGDFEEEEEIDLAALVPLVAKPSSPGNVVPVDEVVGTGLLQV